jgi:hypothetical protein
MPAESEEARVTLKEASRIPKPHTARLFTFILVLGLVLGFAAGRVLPWAVPVRAAEATLSGAQGPSPSGEAGPGNNRGHAAAAASPDALPSTVAGSLYRTYSGTCFTPLGTSSAATAYAGGGGIYRTIGSQDLDCLIELPSGARVTEVIFYFRDNSTATISFRFATYQPDVGAYSNIASTDSAGVEADALVTRMLSGSPLATIDNASYQYLLEVGLPEATSNHVIYGARVGYIIPTTFLPLTTRN